MAKPGFCQYPNYMLEAVFSAPMTCLEKDIVGFIIRRTYGWKQTAIDIEQALLEVLTVAEMAKAVQNTPRSVEQALAHLVSLGVVLKLQTDPIRRGIPMMYGVNPEIEDWGDDADWRRWRADLRGAQQLGLTTGKTVVSALRIQYRQYCTDSGDATVPTVPNDAISPTGSGPRQPPKDSKEKDNCKDERHNDVTPISPAERKRLRQEALTRRREELVSGLPDIDVSLLDGYLEIASQENKSGQISLGGEVSRLQEIIDVRNEFIAEDEANGAQRWRYGMTKAATATRKGGGVGVSNARYVAKCAADWSPGMVATTSSHRPDELRMLNPRGVMVYERDMDELQKKDIRRAIGNGTYDLELGMDWSCDDRHPNYPKGPSA